MNLLSSLVYHAALGGLFLFSGIVNAQDSLNIRLLAHITLPSDEIYGGTVSGGYLYVPDDSTALHVFDIANPSSPTEIGSCSLPPNLQTTVEANGNYACVYIGWDGLRIIDISNPTSPAVVGIFETAFSELKDLQVTGNYIYFGHVDAALRILTIQNPAEPAELGGWNPPPGWQGNRFTVSGNYAYVPAGTSGLWVLDISNPSSPTEVGHSPEIWGSDVAILGNRAYMTDHFSGLTVVDITNPNAPSIITRFDTEGDFQRVTIDDADDSHVYVTAFYGGSNYHDRLKVIDVSDSSDPVETGFYDLPSFAWHVAVSGGIAYIAEDNYLGIYDCSAALGTSPHHTTITPLQFSLLPAYPNPFNATTQIRFDVPRAAFVELKVFDLTGRLVENLAARTFAAGTHGVAFDASNRPSGMYVVRMESGEYSSSQKLALIK